ncbi:MAG: hypothetical protein ABI824_10760 [Acidobacteriota bacterium]
MATELAKVAPVLSIFQQWIREEIEAAVNSLELHQSQRRLLELELLFPSPETSPPSADALRPLLDAAQARWADDRQNDLAELKDHYAQIQKSASGCLGRAKTRVDVLEKYQSRIAQSRVTSYVSVAEEFQPNEMLSPIRLWVFRRALSDFVGFACQGVRDVNKKDCMAAGEGHPDAMDAVGRRIDQAKSKILDAALIKLRAVEANQRVREIQVSPIASQPSTLSVSPKRRRARIPLTIHSPLAAKRMEEFIESSPMKQEAFAEKAGTTARTLLSFRTSGKIRKSILEGIARAMGTTVEDLVASDRKVTGK